MLLNRHFVVECHVLTLTLVQQWLGDRVQRRRATRATVLHMRVDLAACTKEIRFSLPQLNQTNQKQKTIIIRYYRALRCSEKLNVTLITKVPVGIINVFCFLKFILKDFNISINPQFLLHWPAERVC